MCGSALKDKVRQNATQLHYCWPPAFAGFEQQHRNPRPSTCPHHLRWEAGWELPILPHILVGSLEVPLSFCRAAVRAHQSKPAIFTCNTDNLQTCNTDDLWTCNTNDLKYGHMHTGTGSAKHVISHLLLRQKLSIRKRICLQAISQILDLHVPKKALART